MSCRADDNLHDEVERQQASYRELFDHAERLRVENERLRTALLKIEELTSCPGLKDSNRVGMVYMEAVNALGPAWTRGAMSDSLRPDKTTSSS
jgi:hypothetical protein